ncbi:MAG: response regulator, partial [Burkholderiales bacterium]|nr:response regulator [Burkholderiales bacterium]
MAKRILVVTPVIADALALQDALLKARDGYYETVFADSLSSAVEHLQDKTKPIDIILLDCFLPDSKGIASFQHLFAIVPKIPILTICDADHTLAIEAVELGAQGFLTRGHFSSYLVPQSLRNIIQRKAVEDAAYLEKARAEITLNSINDAVIGTDMAGNIDYLNVAAEHITLWKREEAQGKTISTVMPLIQSENRQVKANPVMQVLQQDTATTLTPDTILVRRDGSEVAIEDSTTPI